jgi:hypothetical protein
MVRVRGADAADSARAWKDLVTLGADAAPAAEALRPLLKENDARRSLGARAVLAAAGEDTAAHVGFLIQRAALGKAAENAVAREHLRSLPTPMVADALARAFTDAQPAVRARAIELAGSTPALRESVGVDELLGLLGDADAEVRESALQAIHQHLAPAPPAKATAPMTPDRRKKLQPLLADAAKPVAAQAKRLWDKLGLR